MNTLESTATERTRRALLLPAVAAGAALMSVAAADASAATYVDKLAGGGKVVLKVDGGRLRQGKATIPAGCESNNGRRWRTRLAINLRGNVPLRSGRFSIQGQAPSGVRYRISGRLRNGTIAGRVRLTFLDLDFVGPSDDSYLCDTGTKRFRAD